MRKRLRDVKNKLIIYIYKIFFILFDRKNSILLNIFNNRIGSIEFAEFFTDLHIISMSGLNYGNSDPQSNGEYSLLDRLKQNLGSKDFVFFDVGANIGDYVKYASIVLPDSSFYCFEPSKETFKELLKNTQDLSNIICENIGIGEANKEVLLYRNSNINALSSIYKRDLSFINIEYDQIEKIQLNTLDNYCNEKGISKIDFLKLDIEGNEFNALLGATQLLNVKRIRYIQFEVGGCNIDSKVFWKDIYYLLSPNYRLFRILKDGIYEFTEYREYDETFVYANYFAQAKN